MAEALYRKYRPQVFEDVVGQEPIERTLKNAIEQDKVSHAYLFTGPRGTGKTTTARLLAKALLCEKGPTPDPDGTCEDCELIAEGAHPDVYELDAASRTGVENVREEIISRVQFAPTRGRFKVYIIDEVHMLSTAAFNALLKTLEEPPSHVVFILCTTDPQKVPETIHSRCQRFDFRRIAPESMVSRLGAICMAEDVEFEGEALDLIAHRAEGGLRNALTSLEQIIAFENGKVTLAGAERLLGSIDSNDLAEIMAYVGKRDIANCFRWTASYIETGADLAQFVRDMAEHVRNLYVMSLVGDDVDLEVSETTRRELAHELQWYGPDRLSRLLGVLGDLMAELKTSSNPRLAFEIALTRMVRPDSDLTIESLAERVEALESGYSSVAHVLPGEPANMSAGHPYGDDGEAVSAPVEQQVAVSSASQPYQAQQAHAAVQPQRVSQSEPAPQMRDDLRAQPLQRERQPQGAQAVQPAAQSQRFQQPTGESLDAASPQSEQAVVQGAAGLAALENPAALQRIWQAALSTVKKQKQAYGVLFMNTKVQFDAASSLLKVVFPSESSFAFNAVQKSDVQEALANALSKAAGTDVPFCYEQGTAARGQAGTAQREARQQPQQHQQQRAGGEAPLEPQGAGRIQSHDAGFAQAQPQVQQEVRRQPQHQQSQVRPSHQPQGQAQAQAQPQQDPHQAYRQSPAQQVPSDQVPYDEVPYEEVPYDDFGYDVAPYDESTYEPYGADSARQAPAADIATSPSPIEPNLTPDGSIAENADELQALLQAGFGGGVVFTEVDE